MPAVPVQNLMGDLSQKPHQPSLLGDTVTNNTAPPVVQNGKCKSILATDFKHNFMNKNACDDTFVKV